MLEDLVGRTLVGRYRVEAFLGHGGMSEVFKAYDTRRSTWVALKLLREDLAEDIVFLRRFEREASALERLSHPNIVRFYEFERDRDLAFIVMEYIDGTNLRRYVHERAEPLPFPEILRIMAPVCSALHYAHQAGVTHRDIKPANIMLERTGRVVVSDFGIARLAEAGTSTSFHPGTPAYMSPEQCLDEEPDGRSDIYSLGITLYSMLTGGERPFTGDAGGTGSASRKILQQHINQEPPPPSRYNADLDPEIDQVVLKALAKDREDRYQDALEFYDAVREALGEEGETQAGAAPWAEEMTVTPLPLGLEGEDAGATPVGPTPDDEAYAQEAALVRPRRRRLPVRPLATGTQPMLLAVLATGMVALLALAGVLVLVAKMQAPAPTATPQPTAAVVGPVATVATASAPVVIIREVTAPVPTGTPDALGTAAALASPTASPTGTSSATPTDTPTPTSTPTSTPSTTPTPTMTRTPSTTPTPSMTPTPTPTGPSPITAGNAGRVDLLSTLQGHGDVVDAVAISRDNATVASGSWDATARLWYIPDSSLIRTLSGHGGAVTGVDFSPDGAVTATSSADGTARLWWTADGTLLQTLTGHTDRVTGVAFSGDGVTVATSSADGTLRVWRVIDGALMATLTGHTGPVLAVAYSPRGPKIASGSADNTVRIWKASDGSLTRTMKGHTGAVNGVAFSRDGETVASASEDKTVRLWRLGDGKLLRTLKGHSAGVDAVAFSPDGSVVATASKDNTIRLWRVSDGKCLRTLQWHTAEVFAVAFSRNAYTLASASADRTVRLWGIPY